MVRGIKRSVNRENRPHLRKHRPWDYLRQILICNLEEAHHLWDAVNAAIIMQIVEQGHLTIDGLCRLELNRLKNGKLSVSTISYKYLTNYAKGSDDSSILPKVLSAYQLDILKAKYAGTLGASTWIPHTETIDEDTEDADGQVSEH